MAYLTDRKRVRGLGATGTGTDHHWSMTLSAVGLLILVPLFVFTFGARLGGSYEEVHAYFAQPFPAIVAALTVTVGMMHFKNGVRIMIEDYVHGTLREALIIASALFAYAIAAIGLFAIARIAL